MIFQKIIITACAASLHLVSSFIIPTTTTPYAPYSRLFSTKTPDIDLNLENSVKELKKVLTREYITFFSPMETEHYAKDVTFQDPMMSISGVGKYQENVDMLAGRTLKGKILFSDAGISLHSVTGGEIMPGNQIADVITRWTLRVTAKVLPWKPTARFSGISVYKLKANKEDSSKPPIQIVGQTDYWDSININPNTKDGQYQSVPTNVAIQDFIDQVKPGSFEAKQSGPELPYELLRRGNGYEVRRYPKYASVTLPYRRRDEGFGSLGSFTRGMNPLAPAIMKVENSDTADKYMSWPLAYQPPNDPTADVPIPSKALENAGQGQWRTLKVQEIESQVMAVGFFADASMGPVVRKADRELRECLERDGLVPQESEFEEGGVMFAQYDAIFSMGKRRGEVWVPLKDGGHPW